MSKTKKLITGVVFSLTAGSLAGCGNDLPPTPDEQSCRDWDWDDELGVWECDERGSAYHGFYYFGGLFYNGRSALLNSSGYKKYKSSSSFKGGFGSGSSGGFGG